MERLRHAHIGQTAWIIGKGPSLAHLTAADLGPGPVIAINQAILAAEKLGVLGPIYSLQKDGGSRKRYPILDVRPECDHAGDCGDRCGDMVRPERATLLLHDRESAFCFPAYGPRIVCSLPPLGLSDNVSSIVMAVYLARWMGCSAVRFVACDAHTHGVTGCYVPGQGVTHDSPGYVDQVAELRPHLDGLDVQWLTPGPPVVGPIKIGFGVLVNDRQRLSMVLQRSELNGEVQYVEHAPSATVGLNQLLDTLEAAGCQVAALVHQDMWFPRGWLDQARAQLAKLPPSWITAGIIGKDAQGRVCGRFHDRRIPDWWDTSSLHTFPHPAVCFDECVILVNLATGFRFDEGLDGWDLYGTLAVLQTWEMGGTAWILDAFAEHYCMRPFSWCPDESFRWNFKWMWDRYQALGPVDSTVLGGPPQERAFATSA